MKKSVLLIMCLIGLGVAPRVLATRYNSAASGPWHTSTTWTPLGVPQDADDVSITNHTISLDQNEHAELLSINGGTLNADTHNLIIDSSTAIYGGGYLRNGSFNLSTLNLSSGGASDGSFDIGTFNLSGVLQEDTKLLLSGTCSNVNFEAVESGRIALYNDATMAGDWLLTNIVFSVSGSALSTTPSLTLDGTNSKLSFSSGQLRDGIITNHVPFEVPPGSGTRHIYGCHIHSYEDTDFYDTGMIFQYSSWHNCPGVTHRMNVDGNIFGSTGYSTYYNQGTFCKAAGDGTSGTNVKFIDTAGTIEVDTGTLWLSNSENEFRNTHVAMASGTTFRMAGSICSNMTISATGPATVRVASDGYNDQTINTDLAITGPVKVELAADKLTMTGAITGSEASFEWRGGQIKDSHMTNAVPTVFSSTSTTWRYLWDSTLTLQAGMVHTNMRVAVRHSTIINEVGSYYQLLGDARLLSNYESGQMVNKGHFIKTGGSGTTDVDLPFLNQAGTIGAEVGKLRFSSTLDLTNGGLELATNRVPA